MANITPRASLNGIPPELRNKVFNRVAADLDEVSIVGRNLSVKDGSGVLLNRRQPVSGIIPRVSLINYHHSSLLLKTDQGVLTG